MIDARIRMSPQGPELSRLAFGAWRLAEWDLSPAELHDLVAAALDLGLTTFDHADLYGSYTCEARFGEALALDPGLRDRMEIVTKCGIKLVSPNRPDHRLKHYDTSPAHILASVENSLRALGTDRIDLLLIHRPDPFMDADEVALAFTRLQESGKVLNFGVSNFTPSQFNLLVSRLDFPLVTNQIEWSVLHLDPLYDGTLDQLQRIRTSPMVWSPLGGGRLFTADTPRAARVRAALEQVGMELGGAALDQVALAWLLAHPVHAQVVLGTGKLERLESAVGALGLSLTREQWFAILEASQGEPVP